jgi:predicted dehydrogenase
VLQRSDIDAVEIATPDHWHALCVLHAAAAKKDIYCQKPLALTVKQGRLMSDAVKKHKVIFQTGSQQKSDSNFRRAAELVRNGRIGKLQTVKVGLPSGRPDYGRTADKVTAGVWPDGFEYDRWLGPAQWKPYCAGRTHVNFRWILDYSGGQLTDWGGHHPDCAQWGMGTEYTGPVKIVNAKGNFPTHPIYDTASDYEFEAIYENGVKMIVSSKVKGGVTYEGTQGWVWANRGIHDASSAEIKNSVIGDKELHLYKSDDHFRNFIDGVLTRKECVAPCEVAHRSITICHLGNIAMRLNRNELRWDPKTERILGDSEASAMLDRPYRQGYELPTEL